MSRFTNTWRKKGCLVLVGLVFVCMVFGMITGRNAPRNTATAPTSGTLAVAAANVTAVPAAPVATDAPTAVPEPTAAPTAVALPKVGEQVDVEDVSWKVEEAIDAGDTIKSTNQFVKDLQTPGKLIRVRLTVQNNGKDQAHVSASSMEITDSKGRTFKGNATGEALMVAGDDNCGFQELPSGIPKTCHLIFEVPKDATGLHFKASNLALLMITTKEIDLGL